MPVPTWITGTVLSAPHAVTSILIAVATLGKPGAGPSGRPVISARLTYDELQSFCHLARASVARSIRYAASQGWLTRLPDRAPNRPTTYVIPQSLDSPDNAPLAVPREAPRNIPNGPRSSETAPDENQPFPGSTGELPDRPLPQPAPGPAEFYTSVLAAPDQVSFAQARLLDGLDNEIAILRTRLRDLLARDPGRIDLCLRSIATIARLVTARQRLGGNRNEQLKTVIQKVITEIAASIGPDFVNAVLRNLAGPAPAATTGPSSPPAAAGTRGGGTATSSNEQQSGVRERSGGVGLPYSPSMGGTEEG